MMIMMMMMMTMMMSKRKIVTWVVCRLALLEVRGTSRSGYSNYKHCHDDDDDDIVGTVADNHLNNADDKCLKEKQSNGCEHLCHGSSVTMSSGQPRLSSPPSPLS